METLIIFFIKSDNMEKRNYRFDNIKAILIIFVILHKFLQQKHRDGYIFVLYMLMYSVLRFCVEFFRGDEVRGIFGFLSTSQWISLVTIPLGIYCLVVAPEKNFLNRLYTPKIKQEQN